ncbi:MAG TPA: hypothetical protein VIH61_07395, partial [Waddliaceae bacterium]
TFLIDTHYPVIASTSWEGFHEESWKILEPFLDYRKGEMAIQKVLPLLLLKEQMAKKGLTQELQQKLELTIKQLIASYHRYLTVQRGEFASPYGSERKPDIFDILSFGRYAEFECSVADGVALLESLKDKPHLFSKLLELLVEDMGSRLDSKERNETWEKGRSVYLEGILYNNGFALLSLLRKQGIDDAYIEIILRYVKEPIELSMVSILLLSDRLKPRFLSANGGEKEKLTLILKDVITIYFQAKLDLTRLKYVYKCTYISFKSIEKVLDGIEFTYLLFPIVDYLTQIDGNAFDVDASLIPLEMQKRLQTAPSFTSKQIINAARKGDQFSTTLQKGDLSATVEMVRKESKASDLQIITHAVEHGSERDGTEATLIEAFQNSLDAIRGYIKKNPECSEEKVKVSFDVRIVQKTDVETPHLVLELSDYIGMSSLKTLLADFLIPNYSEKSKEGESVGEMGNGSYQMYRDAEMVTVMTRTIEHPSKIYFLRIVPLRDPETQEVVDLRHKCIDVTDSIDSQFVGTELRVLMRNPQAASKTAIELEGIAVRTYIKETFAVANPPLGDKQLNVELKLPQGRGGVLPTRIDRTDPPFEIEGSPFSCYKMRASLNPSFVLTEGYPFKSLATFLKEEKLLPPELAMECSQGWCLNIPTGSYAPVQSRTRLQLKKEIQEKLRTFLVEWIYYRSLCQEGTGPQQRYYPHFHSECSNFDQVFPGIRGKNLTQEELKEGVLSIGDFSSLEAFFTSYKPSFMKKSFLSHIQKGYQTLVPTLQQHKNILNQVLDGDLKVERRDAQYTELVDEYRRRCRQAIIQWRARLSKKTKCEELFFNQILIPWFTKKCVHLDKEVPSIAQLIVKNLTLQTKDEKKERELRVEKVQKSLEQIPNHKAFVSSAESILKRYCRLYAKRVPLSNDKEIGVYLYYNPTDQATAGYLLDSHEIRVNVAYVSLSSILEMGKHLVESKPLYDNRLVSATCRRTGILNHELEHARRGDGCNGHNVHSYANDAAGNYIDFEACAASFAHITHQCGLMEEWSRELGQFPLPTQEELLMLKKLELSDPAILASILFPE